MTCFFFSVVALALALATKNFAKPRSGASERGSTPATKVDEAASVSTEQLIVAFLKAIILYSQIVRKDCGTCESKKVGD